MCPLPGWAAEGWGGVTSRGFRWGGGSVGRLESCAAVWEMLVEEVVPYVWELVLPQVPVEGWVLNADEHGLLNGPGLVVNFIVHYVKLF